MKKYNLDLLKFLKEQEKLVDNETSVIEKILRSGTLEGGERLVDK